MATPILLLSTMLLLSSLLLPNSASAQTCSNTVSNRLFTTCSDLLLDSSLHWTYNNATVDLAFRVQTTSGKWVAWGLNPNGSGMIGGENLVARRLDNGTMKVWTTQVSDSSPDMKEAALSFAVRNLSANYTDGYMVIFATVDLPDGRTTLNHVWQVSDQLNDEGYPSGHSFTGDNVLSKGSLNFLSGVSVASSDSTLRRKNTHGVLNVVSWGVLMPLGAIIARYLRVFKWADPAWFYLHVACQCSAYVVGVAGWGTGLKLGSDSVGITYDSHRNIGIALFCFATLQVFALLLRPNKDHKYRIFWNAYHHSIGYLTIVLSIVNIFKGFDILDPEKKWKNAYVGILIALGAIALVLEVLTWIVVLKRRSREKVEKNNVNVNNNGYVT